MLFTRRRAPRFLASQGFSLVELSVVVAIMSVVAVLGLEGAANFVNRTSGALTKERLVVVDDAVDRFFKVYGRLPCPAVVTDVPTASTYGYENCTISVFPTTLPAGNYTVLIGGGLMKGAVPFRSLGISAPYALDGFGNKINYVVTKNLTSTGGGTAAGTNYRFASSGFGTQDQNGVAGIEIRTGVLEQPCGGAAPPKCQVVAAPPTDGAAYILYSNGADKRGAYSARGSLQLGSTIQGSCTPSPTASYSPRVDSQNCTDRSAAGQAALTVSGGGAIPYNVYYDNRYNAGLNLVSYFDDYVIWRSKAQL